MQFRRLELKSEYLNFRHAGPCRQVDRFRRELECPDDLLDLLYEQVFEAGVCATVRVYLALGQRAAIKAGC